jgi:NADH:ubiquinone oxidoreductase subunit 6 (subunit J)
MDVGLGPSIAFWIMAVVAVGSALGVIILRDLFRAALFLVLTFLTMAGLFVTLNADFVAVVQILIYAGAISILLIFGILLTGQVQRGNPSNQLQAPAVFLGVLLTVTLVVAFLNTNFRLAGDEPTEGTTSALADSLFNSFLLPFEIASVLLLAAVIGAIVLAQGADE